MITLSKLRFKKTIAGMNAHVNIGNRFVSVSYTPDWKGNAGNCYGDGKAHWEVATGVRGSDPATWTVTANATRQQVNTILKNVAVKGRMEAAHAS